MKWKKKLNYALTEATHLWNISVVSWHRFLCINWYNCKRVGRVRLLSFAIICVRVRVRVKSWGTADIRYERYEWNVVTLCEVIATLPNVYSSNIGRWNIPPVSMMDGIGSRNTFGMWKLKSIVVYTYNNSFRCVAVAGLRTTPLSAQIIQRCYSYTCYYYILHASSFF